MTTYQLSKSKCTIDSVAIVKEENKWSTILTIIHVRKQMCLENFSAGYENAVQYAHLLCLWLCGIVYSIVSLYIALWYCDYVNDNLPPK